MSPLCPTPRVSLNSNGSSPVTDSGQRETDPANRHWFDTTALSSSTCLLPINVLESLESLEVGMWELQRCDYSCSGALLISRLPETCGYIEECYGASWIWRNTQQSEERLLRTVCLCSLKKWEPTNKWPREILVRTGKKYIFYIKNSEFFVWILNVPSI